MLFKINFCGTASQCILNSRDFCNCTAETLDEAIRIAESCIPITNRNNVQVCDSFLNVLARRDKNKRWVKCKAASL